LKIQHDLFPCSIARGYIENCFLKPAKPREDSMRCCDVWRTLTWSSQILGVFIEWGLFWEFPEMKVPQTSGFRVDTSQFWMILGSPIILHFRKP
jgi:hypothetical protein